MTAMAAKKMADGWVGNYLEGVRVEPLRHLAGALPGR